MTPQTSTRGSVLRHTQSGKSYLVWSNRSGEPTVIGIRNGRPFGPLRTIRHPERYTVEPTRIDDAWSK